ncbi:CaiB/BaiF CoA transferase family protein [Methylobacterium platani]|uniref:CoA-transferase n=2 Tax=Methylobacterium platani TaxID=427683 RepID=A0A179S081_9HYPH|nr:CoA transferase [Methylobacterium platani]KMO11693.1 CoA-transferase [Methylobacterium platani JCM 14648]OAS18487.1 CoA-transferase [Methylobacterium platani]
MSAACRPLAGIRVVDLTTVVVGPACTLRLSDFGAEVIKVEPRGGDVLRSLGGPSPAGRHAGSYLHLNRGKRAVGLDLKRPAARAVLGRLIATSDVLVANMRPEALARLGLDAATLRAGQPGLVHCTITGFGPDGPYRGRPAYDSVVQGVSGIAGLAERRDGRPAYAPLLLADHVTGEIAASAILAALVARGRTGAGATLEVPMHETMAAFVLAEHLGPRSFDPPLGPAGDARVLNPDNRPLATADGWISLTANTDAQVHAFLRAVGRAELIEDPRLATVADRFRHVDLWFRVRAEALAERTTAEWLAIFAAADVPAMPCHTLETLERDPHLAAVGLIGTGDHPTEGRVRTLRPTILHDGATAPAGRPAPPPGFDTRAVLAELGFPETESAALIAGGAAFDGE